METPVKIIAEVLAHDPKTCKFTLEKPVLPGTWLRFRTREQAAGSPLAERLFAIEGVANVILNEAEILVSQGDTVNWRDVGPKVGAAIRAHLASGEKAASETAMKNAPAEDLLRQKVQKILDYQINPSIAAHNGYITLMDVRGKDLFIQMGGGCQGCSAADVTLRQGVETALREQVPEIGLILDSTDHAAGENPYYSSHYPER